MISVSAGERDAMISCTGFKRSRGSGKITSSLADSSLIGFDFFLFSGQADWKVLVVNVDSCCSQFGRGSSSVRAMKKQHLRKQF